MHLSFRLLLGARSLLAALAATAPGLAAQALPQTTAERTNYAATSTNAEVGAFLDSLELAGAPIAVSEMGTTALGKPIYFVITSDPTVTSPGEAVASGKLVVYLQANIHGGEVEGMEAVLAVLRELAAPLDPNGPSGPTAFVRDRMLPALRKTLQDRYHEPIFDYGNVEIPQAPQGWDTYAPLGWYGTNYVGLRGRMAILSEAYSHADFKSRVQVTHDFLVEILSYAALHADDIRRLERDADRLTTLEGAGLAKRPALGVAYKLGSRGEEPVLLEVMKAGADTERGRPRLVPTGEVRAYRIPVKDRFLDSLARPLPAGYFLPGAAGETATLLRLHGIQVQRLAAAWTDTVEALTGPQLKWAPREFQGHHLLEVSGTWTRASRTVPAGAYLVSTAQPPGRPVFAPLEPGGFGLARWGVFDRLLGAEFGALSGMVYGSTGVGEFPVWRAVRPPRAAQRAVP